VNKFEVGKIIRFQRPKSRFSKSPLKKLRNMAKTPLKKLRDMAKTPLKKLHNPPKVA